MGEGSFFFGSTILVQLGCLQKLQTTCVPSALNPLQWEFGHGSAPYRHSPAVQVGRPFPEQPIIRSLCVRQ